VALANPFQHHLWPPCPLHRLTGLWCPFCGGTRALWAAAHLQFRLMVHEDVLLPAVAFLAAWGWLAWLGRSTGWWQWPDPRNPKVEAVAAAVLVCFTVLRNLPWLAVLAPLGRT